MVSNLEPMFELTKRSITYDKGRFPLQLEIPEGSTLSESDIERVLYVSSWEHEDMSSAVEGFEGARGVRIAKENPGYVEGIQTPDRYIAGVGSRKMKRSRSKLEGIFTYTGDMVPPSRKNFYTEIGFRNLEGGTSEIVDGELRFSRRDYSPLGSYSESEAREKIKGTIEARNMALSLMAVPKVEAYGRYLQNGDGSEPMTMIVFQVPRGKRLGETLINTFRGSYNGFLSYMDDFASSLGAGAREMHDKWKCHRQLHFDNVYYNKEWPGSCKLYVMDWATLRTLRGRGDMNKALDIKIPWQKFKSVQQMMFKPLGGKASRMAAQRALWQNAMLFTGRIFNSYYGIDADIMSFFETMRSQGIKNEMDFTIEVMRRLY